MKGSHCYYVKTGQINYQKPHNVETVPVCQWKQFLRIWICIQFNEHQAEEMLKYKNTMYWSHCAIDLYFSSMDCTIKHVWHVSRTNIEKHSQRCFMPKVACGSVLVIRRSWVEPSVQQSNLFSIGPLSKGLKKDSKMKYPKKHTALYLFLYKWQKKTFIAAAEVQWIEHIVGMQ